MERLGITNKDEKNAFGHAYRSSDCSWLYGNANLPGRSADASDLVNILGRAKEDLPGIFGRQTDFRSSPVAIEPLPPSDNPTSFDNRFGDWRSCVQDAAPVLAHQFAIARNQATICLVSKNLLRRRANHRHNFIVGKIQKPALGNRTRDFRWTLQQLSSRILKQLAGRRRTTLLPPHFRDAVRLGVYPRKWR
jgi:hypothetical protein